LNNFGIYHLSGNDIRFQGNRRKVELAVLSSASGEGLAVLGGAMDIGVENTQQGVVLSQNACVAGRGNKGSGPETSINAGELKRISGRFAVEVLAEDWPPLLTRWFGQPRTPAGVQNPFYYSYDQ
jgi:hypothetical protein